MIRNKIYIVLVITFNRKVKMVENIVKWEKLIINKFRGLLLNIKYICNDLDLSEVNEFSYVRIGWMVIYLVIFLRSYLFKGI